ncbi:MAG: chemotaxis protein CheW [Anaerolineae bacterium]|nr:chemotaxis protein CheW [Anaerolineae bacterium]
MEELSEGYLRIKAERVTQLLDLVGELSLSATAVMQHPRVRELEELDSALHRLGNLIRELQTLSSGLRLVSIGTVLKRMQRLVRDLSHQTGKPLELVIEGGEVQVDKNLVDQLHDPLVHLVRNAVDHGIESPEERAASGKPPVGRITLTALQRGREVHIQVADDGRGLNREAILERAREMGIVAPNEEPDDQTVWRYIFYSGLSTVQRVSSLSGRGVGLDVVQAAVKSLQGRILVDTAAGKGTCITLCIPITLAFLDSLVTCSRGRLYALPIDVVREVIKPSVTQIVHSTAGNAELIRVRDELIPIRRLSRFYHESGEERPLAEQMLVVVHTTGGPVGIPVEEVVGQQSVTVKPLQGISSTIRGGAAYALLESGEVAIVLDCEQVGE